MTHDLVSLLGQYGLAVVFANAARVAKILMNSGFTKVRPLHGGSRHGLRPATKSRRCLRGSRP
ncbi:MAG TPA: hypothetical protein VN989_03420 [Casimicrobiaceae bacterium]|nr:hypothetical protein [Casimicrobiaceae bacterium]